MVLSAERDPLAGLPVKEPQRALFGSGMGVDVGRAPAIRGEVDVQDVVFVVVHLEQDGFPERGDFAHASHSTAGRARGRLAGSGGDA